MSEYKLVPVEPTEEMWREAVSMDVWPLTTKSFLRLYAAMIKAAPEVDPWLPIAKFNFDVESNPVWLSDGIKVEIGYWVQGAHEKVWCDNEVGKQLKFVPTHWMPLPSPPKKHNKQAGDSK